MLYRHQKVDLLIDEQVGVPSASSVRPCDFYIFESELNFSFSFDRGCQQRKSTRDLSTKSINFYNSLSYKPIKSSKDFISSVHRFSDLIFPFDTLL